MFSFLAFFWRLPHDVVLLVIDLLVAVRASKGKRRRSSPDTPDVVLCKTHPELMPDGNPYAFCERADRYCYPVLFRLICPYCSPQRLQGARVLRCTSRRHFYRFRWWRLVSFGVVLVLAATLLTLAPSWLGQLRRTPPRKRPVSAQGKPSGSAPAGHRKSKTAAKASSTHALAEQAREMVANGRYASGRSSYLKAIRLNPTDVDLRLEFARVACGTDDRQLAIDHLKEAQALAPNRADCQYALASALADALRYREASEPAAKAVTLAKNNAQYRALHARVLLALGRADEANAEAGKAVALAAEDADCRLVMGDTLLAQGNYREAEEQFREAARLAPENRFALVGQARIGTFRRELDQADQVLRTLAIPALLSGTRHFNLSETRIPPETGTSAVTRFSVRRFDVEAGYELQARVAEARTELAEACFALHRPNQAIEALRELTGDHPRLLTIRARLAQMLLQNGQVDAAYQVAEKLLKDAPNDIGANLVLATVFFSRGLYDRAREHAQEALDSPVDDLRQPSARKLLARTYVHQGDYEKAAQQYAQLVQDLPELQDGYLQLAMCQEADRQTDKALETLTQARNQFPDSSGPVAAMGLFLLRQNKQDEAIKTFREAITKTPPDPISFNNLATLLADRDQTEEAVGYARTAARLFPRHWGILDTLGWIHCRQGDVKEGLPYLNQALALAPENREIQYHLGYALAKLKRFDAARWHLRIALSGTGPFTGTEAAAKLLASLPGE